MSDLNVESSTMAPGVYDPLADEASQNPPESSEVASSAQSAGTKKPHVPLVEFYSLGGIASFEEPPNQKMAGDYHLQRGAMTVLAGPPGCGKSRAAMALALAGARGEGTWLGLPIHCRFKTLILQNENGLARLRRDLPKGVDLEPFEDWVRISSPPVVGLAIHNPMFRADLKQVVREFQPDLIILDPFNATTRDAMEKDFSESLTRIREIAAESANQPACLILHHLRKPKSDDRHKGRNLTHLLAGSYVLVSIARAVLVMQPATDDTEDDRVVVTPAKNNDGDLGPRTALRRKSDGFEVLSEFDWAAHDGGAAVPEAKVKPEHLRSIFDNGKKRLPLAKAVTRLMSEAKVGRSAAYDALKLNGRYSDFLGKSPDDECLFLRAAQDEFSDE